MTPQDIAIAQRRAEGKTMQQIATAEGINKSTVCRKLSRDELQEYITAAREALIADSLPKAIRNINHAIDRYTDTDADTQLREHGYKSSIQVMQAANILPNPNQQIVINNQSQITESIQQIINNYGHSLSIPPQEE